ncbi:MAG TPA: type II toxin-antitoxin system VapC family toxin [Solirubrobacteraceae bacterium]|nr:type II toxin-antitoxin system VapC family toxin [Solirubrobacteraceae bacterium]
MSPLLLDTQALLWSVGDTNRLSSTAREVLSAGVVPAYVSAASVWEIAIKRASGKLEAPDDLLEQIVIADFGELGITFKHAMLAGALPPHHRDPFDRMLVAQAQSERLILVTNDARIAAYDVPVLW